MGGEKKREKGKQWKKEEAKTELRSIKLAIRCDTKDLEGHLMIWSCFWYSHGDQKVWHLSKTGKQFFSMHSFGPLKKRLIEMGRVRSQEFHLMEPVLKPINPPKSQEWGPSLFSFQPLSCELVNSQACSQIMEDRAAGCLHRGWGGNHCCRNQSSVA